MLSSVETPISGDDVIFDKLKYTALTYNRNTPEMVEDTYAAAEDITASVADIESEGDWEIFCLEHGIQPDAVDIIFPFVSGTVKKIPAEPSLLPGHGEHQQPARVACLCVEEEDLLQHACSFRTLISRSGVEVR